MAKTEYVLWGTKAGDEAWEEQLIVCTSDKAKLHKAKQWAKDNGFTRLRVSLFHEGDKPDFGGTVNV